MTAYLHRWSIIISYILNCMPVSFISFQVYGMILTSFLLFSIHFSSNLYRKGKYILRERQKPDAWASLPGRASSGPWKMSEVTHKTPWEGILWGQVVGCASRISLSCTTTGLRDADSLAGKRIGCGSTRTQRAPYNQMERKAKQKSEHQTKLLSCCHLSSSL